MDPIASSQSSGGGEDHCHRLAILGAMTAGIAHDLNNLLTIMSGQLHLLEQELALEPRPHRAARTCLKAARQGASLVRRLLTFAQGERTRSESVEIAGVLAECGELLAVAAGKNVNVRVRVEAGLPRCRAEKSQLQAALLNLGLNGRDAMPAGGELSLAAVRAPDTYDRAGDRREHAQRHVLVSVRDTGSGIPDTVLESVGKPFFTTKADTGTGLGLAMVYRFARDCGGRIVIDSTVGEGTTVDLYLPAAGENATPEDDGNTDNHGAH